MYFRRCILIIVILSLVSIPITLAEDLKESEPEIVGTITDDESSWYAITKIGGRKKKLCAKGDIFCSDADITKCFRIVDIKKDSLLLRDVNSKGVISIKPGEKIPLQGTEIIFEKTVQADIIEYRYKDSKESGDFTVREEAARKIVLEKDYDKRALANSEKIETSLFEDIKVKKVGENTLSVDRESTKRALTNAGNTLISVIKRTRPQFRFGEGPSLRFSCGLGDVVLDREGFLIKNLAVARLVERAGIREGDLIRSVNGQPVNSLFGIYKAYKDVKSNPGINVVKVDIIRDGRPTTLTYNVR